MIDLLGNIDRGQHGSTFRSRSYTVGEHASVISVCHGHCAIYKEGIIHEGISNRSRRSAGA